MSHTIYGEYKIFTQATIAPVEGYFGYFTIYAAGFDPRTSHLVHREPRHNIPSTLSMWDALEAARQRAFAWIDSSTV